MSFSVLMVAGLLCLVGVTVYRRSRARGLVWMMLGVVVAVPAFDPALRSSELFRETFVAVLGAALLAAGFEAFLVLRANRLRQETEAERLAKRVSGLR
jgi:hypothetical protein